MSLNSDMQSKPLGPVPIQEDYELLCSKAPLRTWVNGTVWDVFTSVLDS